MASENADLIARFGGGKDAASTTIVSPNADLINKFTKGEVEAVHPAEVQVQPDYRPKPMTDAEIAASQQNMPSSPIVQDIKSAPSYIARTGLENYKAAKQLTSKGVGEIGSGQSATGVGNAALGALGQVTAYPSAVLSGISKMGDKLGSDIGTRGVDVATSGLPIAKGIKITSANFIPSNRAVNKIIETVGPENLAEGLQRMRDNPRLSPADVFPAVRSMAQGLATEVGPQQTILTKAVDARKAGAKDAVTGAFNETMGAPVNVLDKINEMKAKAKETGEKLINPVVAKSGPANITDAIKHIDSLIADNPIGAATLKAIKEGRDIGSPSLSPTQQRLLSLRQELRGDWKDADTMHLDVNGEQGLHRIQKDLRYEAQTLLDSQGSDKLLGGKLMGIRNKLVDSIDAQSGGTAAKAGEYKTGLGQYRDDMHIQDAFEKGQDILRNRPTKYEDRPELWAQWKKNANDNEVQAAREGARLAVDQQVNGMRNAVGQKGTEIPQIDFNAQKLKLLFSEKEVNQMFKKLKDERDIAETNHKIWEGSQTQFREGGQRAIKVRDNYKPSFSNYLPIALEGATAYASGGSVLGAGALTGYGYEGVRKLINKTGQNLDRKTNNEIANLSVSTGEAREALMDALSNSLTKGKLTMAQKLQLALPTGP